MAVKFKWSFRELFKNCGSKCKTSTDCNPQASEQFSVHIKHELIPATKIFEPFLTASVCTVRSTYHTVHKASPGQLVFGFAALLQIDLKADWACDCPTKAKQWQQFKWHCTLHLKFERRIILGPLAFVIIVEEIQSNFSFGMWLMVAEGAVMETTWWWGDLCLEQNFVPFSCLSVQATLTLFALWSHRHFYSLLMFSRNGVPKDCSKAAKWFHLGASKGDATAQFYLGFMNLHGVRGLKDSTKGNGMAPTSHKSRLYHISVQYRNNAWQGTCRVPGFKHGTGVAPKAANQGVAKAQCYVGLSFLMGDNALQDPIKVRQGDKGAMKLLSLMDETKI